MSSEPSGTWVPKTHDAYGGVTDKLRRAEAHARVRSQRLATISDHIDACELVIAECKAALARIDLVLARRRLSG